MEQLLPGFLSHATLADTWRDYLANWNTRCNGTDEGKNRRHGDDFRRIALTAFRHDRRFFPSSLARTRVYLRETNCARAGLTRCDHYVIIRAGNSCAAWKSAWARPAGRWDVTSDFLGTAGLLFPVRTGRRRDVSRCVVKVWPSTSRRIFNPHRRVPLFCLWAKLVLLYSMGNSLFRNETCGKLFIDE